MDYTSMKPPSGLALYVDFTATPDDWAAYRRGWCAEP
jgi:hypothetical protein